MSSHETIPEDTVESTAVELVHVEQPPTTLFRTDDPIEVVEKAARVADALKEILKRQGLTKRIGNKDHVLVEGWTTLGSMLGVVPVVVWTRKLDNGWEARVEARTLDGRIVGAAEAECLTDEGTWKKRDDYALRSMAQTRATSKALRGPLGFIVTLAGFQATPAEEMPQPAANGSAPTPAAAPTLDESIVTELNAAAGDLLKRSILDEKHLKTNLVAAGAVDLRSVKAAIRTLTPDQADELRSTFADLLSAAEPTR